MLFAVAGRHQLFQSTPLREGDIAGASAPVFEVFQSTPLREGRPESPYVPQAPAFQSAPA